MQPKLHLKQFVVDPNTGQTICNCGCGTVVEEKMPDNSHFEREDKDSPTKAVGHQRSNIARHDNGLSTLIGDVPFGRITDRESVQNNIFKLKLWQVRTSRKNGDERRLSLILQKIGDICTKLGIPRNIQEDASYIGHKWAEKQQSKGRLVDGVAAACIYIASKRSNYTITIQKLSEVLVKADRHYMMKIFQEMLTLLEPAAAETSSTVKDSRIFLSRACDQLNLPKKIRDAAFLFLDLWSQDVSISGRSPKIRAAVSLSYVSMRANGGKKRYFESSGRNKLNRTTFNFARIGDAVGIRYNGIGPIIRDIDESFIQKIKDRIDV